MGLKLRISLPWSFALLCWLSTPLLLAQKSPKTPNAILGEPLPEHSTFYDIEKARESPLEVIYLDLSDNPAPFSYELLDLFKNLKSLHLSNHPQPDLKSVVDFCPKLEVLYLDSCALLRLPDNLAQLKGLKRLSLIFNELGALPALPKNLENLSLQNNQLRDFPQSLYHLKKLRFLDLSYNQLNRLRGPLNYPYLEKIDLTLNDLSLFPFVPATLPRIRFIGLAGNKIDAREKIRVESIFLRSGTRVQW